MQIIRAKAPLRISFAGGGSDLEPYVSKYGSKIFNVTINKYCHGTLAPRKDNKINIYSQDYDIVVKFNNKKEFPIDGDLQLVKVALKRILGDNNSDGFDIYLSSDAPPGAGLGTSSAIIVVLVGLFRHYYDLKLDKYSTAELAWGIERLDMKLAGGFQDQYSSVFGGFNYMKFDGTPTGAIIDKIVVDRNIINELHNNLILCYTGKTHKSSDLIKDTVKNMESKEKTLHRIKDLAPIMKRALSKNLLDKFGLALFEGWKCKKSLSDKISPPFIEKMCMEAMDKGAIGTKVTGAGAGGLILVYCNWDKKKDIADSLIKNGGTIWDYDFSYKGLETWEIRE